MEQEKLIYFRDGKILASRGDAAVYKMNGRLFLEIDHTLWAIEDELYDYMEQLGDYPRGQCLEVGLGLGVASRYILTFPEVEHLTTAEINKDVIAVHGMVHEDARYFSLDYDAHRHRILNTGGLEYAYQTKRKYDFIFVDCYDRIDEDTLPVIGDMAKACSRLLKPGGKMLGWWDRFTPSEFRPAFEAIFKPWSQYD
jgi:spermidine synthase